MAGGYILRGLDALFSAEVQPLGQTAVVPGKGGGGEIAGLAVYEKLFRLGCEKLVRPTVFIEARHKTALSVTTISSGNRKGRVLHIVL
jgi:hypothetical protein